jgi:hypothetical protein
MGRWWGYKFQWMLSFYLYTLMKDETYILSKAKVVEWKKFNLFAKKLLTFKQKCLDKYWPDFDLNLEVLVEWEDNCLDDISFISWTNDENIDNIIFIQVKTKWWDEWNTIYTGDWIYKAITNFLNNINFLKFSHVWNISFFIITNKNLAQALRKKVNSKGPELYLDFVNHILWLNNLYKSINKDIIISTLKWEFEINSDILKVYRKEEILNIKKLIEKLKIVFDALVIIEDIDYYLLKSELEDHYWHTKFLSEKDRIEDLCWEWIEVKKWTPEFERYRKYKNTYFHPKDWWKLIHELDVITKWKFI